MTSILNEAQEWIKGVLYDDTGIVGGTIGKMETHTGIKREAIVHSMCIAVGLYLVFGYNAGLLCNIIGIVYPTYVSIDILDSNNHEEITQWMTYWMTFALFSFGDFSSETMMGVAPLYWLAKCIFLLWLHLPFTRGAHLLYKSIIRPLLPLSLNRNATQEQNQVHAKLRTRIVAVEPQREVEQPDNDLAEEPDEPQVREMESRETIEARMRMRDPYMQQPPENHMGGGARA